MVQFEKARDQMLSELVCWDRVALTSGIRGFGPARTGGNWSSGIKRS